MTLTLWFSALQAAGTILVAVNLVFFVRQLRLMNRQITAFDNDSRTREKQFEHQTELMAQQVRAQNLFELTKYLESPDHLSARKRVTQIGFSGKPYSKWKDADREAADTVARVWTIAASWQRMGVLPEEYLQRHYGSTVLRHWHTLEPYIEELRQRQDTAQRRSFEELAKEVETLGWYKDGGDARPEPWMPATLPISNKAR